MCAYELAVVALCSIAEDLSMPLFAVNSVVRVGSKPMPTSSYRLEGPDLGCSSAKRTRGLLGERVKWTACVRSESMYQELSIPPSSSVGHLSYMSYRYIEVDKQLDDRSATPNLCRLWFGAPQPS